MISIKKAVITFYITYIMTIVFYFSISNFIGGLDPWDELLNYLLLFLIIPFTAPTLVGYLNGKNGRKRLGVYILAPILVLGTLTSIYALSTDDEWARLIVLVLWLFLLLPLSIGVLLGIPIGSTFRKSTYPEEI